VKTPMEEMQAKADASVRLPDVIRRLFEKGEVYTFVAHDQKAPEVVVYEPDCQEDKIHAVNGYLLVPHQIARRLPEPHGTVTSERGNTPCWKLAQLAGN